MADTTPKELNDFPVGHVVADRYEILEHIGFGGMGFVVKAKDRTLDGDVVALKILYPRYVKDRAILARFRREVILTRKLSHPNIVKIYDIGDAGNGTYFISMEFVAGESLAALLKKSAPRGIPAKEAACYLYQVALGLAYAHSQGVVHRDIKPGNIIITPNLTVKIADFGVARTVESKEQLTRTNEAIGSPHYMSPEQLNASKIDHRSDIYGLGIMAFELFTGKLPFDTEHWLMLVKMHLSDPIPEFASKEQGIPFWCQELVNRASAKDPNDRFRDGYDLARFIAKYSDLSAVSSSGAVPIVGAISTSGVSIGGYLGVAAVALMFAVLGAAGFAIWGGG